MTFGQELAGRFYQTAVKAIVEEVLSGEGYVAGRLGSGSDVLGFDDGRSHDHDFGCRLTVLVDDVSQARLPALNQALEDGLPDEVDGWPTRFAVSWDDTVVHNVDLHTVHDFAAKRLGFDLRTPLTATQWMCVTGQSVLEVAGGAVFHDTSVSYSNVCDALRWYPDDVWLTALAAGWTRLEQELPFVSRTGECSDDVGSRIIASRLCRDIMHLAFLVERRWMPYPKWQGTALRQLACGPELEDALASVLAANDWQTRQQHLQTSIENVAQRHGAAGFELPTPVVHQFYDRPALTTNREIPAIFRDRIVDETVRSLPPIGSIEQWSDNADLLSTPARRASATALYTTG